MSEEETMNSTIGHMADMLNLFAIYKGVAKKKKSCYMSFDDAMELQ